jgi:hypothetical protein
MHNGVVKARFRLLSIFKLSLDSVSTERMFLTGDALLHEANARQTAQLWPFQSRLSMTYTTHSG